MGKSKIADCQSNIEKGLESTTEVQKILSEWTSRPLKECYEIQFEMFSLYSKYQIWRKLNIAFQKKYLMYSWSNLRRRRCTLGLFCCHGTSAICPKTKAFWVIQHDKDLKHTNKTTTEWWKNETLGLRTAQSTSTPWPHRISIDLGGVDAKLKECMPLKPLHMNQGGPRRFGLPHPTWIYHCLERNLMP